MTAMSSNCFSSVVDGAGSVSSCDGGGDLSDLDIGQVCRKAVAVSKQAHWNSWSSGITSEQLAWDLLFGEDVDDVSSVTTEAFPIYESEVGSAPSHGPFEKGSVYGCPDISTRSTAEMDDDHSRCTSTWVESPVPEENAIQQLNISYRVKCSFREAMRQTDFTQDAVPLAWDSFDFSQDGDSSRGSSLVSSAVGLCLALINGEDDASGEQKDSLVEWT